MPPFFVRSFSSRRGSAGVQELRRAARLPEAPEPEEDEEVCRTRILVNCSICDSAISISEHEKMNP